MKTIIDLFEQTESVYPEKTAIACCDTSFSFQEMKRIAIAGAARIRDCTGEKEEQPIAVIVDRDAETAVLFLAVLYSGNYYVPIDPSMPEKKIHMVFDDCKPQCIICKDSMRKLVMEMGYTGQVISFEDIRQSAVQAEEVNWSLPEAEAPAYMIYTSGSTGKPKGVLKAHKAVCSFIQAYAETFQLDEGEVIGNQTPFFFDASAKDIYLMMYTGARLEIIPSELFMFPPKLIMYLNERRISFICWVPTALCMVTQLSTFKTVKPEYLKKVFFVGEVFPIKQLRKWIEALPDITYVNLYGSTELAGIGCYYTIDTTKELEKLPMGKALKNCRVFLMDPDNGQVIRERGPIGEVCIASDALAIEYYHDPEKTEKVFAQMSLPEAGENVKVLKTGDLASYDGDGNLMFASRKDFQIKLMGRRIELGEIEAAVDKLEVIQRCACVFDAEKKKIRLYCELIPGCEWTGKMIREELKTRLSDYMVPSSVKIMEKLPLNANGKIDRTALKNL